MGEGHTVQGGGNLMSDCWKLLVGLLGTKSVAKNVELKKRKNLQIIYK